MFKRTITRSFTISAQIYDSWAELLAGTRFLLDLLDDADLDKIKEANLLRLTLVSSSQMTEVMLFTQLQRIVESKPDTVKELFEYDLNNRISFNEASKKWPEILTKHKLDFSSEPMQSMKRLSQLRNSAIHHTASCPSANIGESAFFTAIEASKYLYNHFNEGCWDSSEYNKFVGENQSKVKNMLLKELGE